jgi:hypothetical protein
MSRGSNRDRDRFDVRRRQFQNWVVNTYPNWPGYGYPYLYDPNAYNLGLYDWDDSDDSASGTSQPASYENGGYESGQAPGSYVSDQNGPGPDYPSPYPSEAPPYPNQGYSAPSQQPAAAPSVPTLEPALTVIFKSGRAPIEVGNYMMTAKVLIDLDYEHYEQIPLDEIDLAATKRFNTFAGVDFQVPGA